MHVPYQLDESTFGKYFPESTFRKYFPESTFRKYFPNVHNLCMQAMNFWAEKMQEKAWMTQLRNCGLGDPFTGRNKKMEGKLGKLLREVVVPFYNQRHDSKIVLREIEVVDMTATAATTAPATNTPATAGAAKKAPAKKQAAKKEPAGATFFWNRA